MPFKYQKLVILFSLGIMLIGFCTFSLLSPDFYMSFGAAPSTDKKNSDASSFGAIHAADGKSGKETQEELEELVKRYLAAKQQVDMDTIGQCVSDISRVDEKKLMAESEYVEGYENIQCMVLDGPRQGTYRVYAYYEVKVYNIDALLPSLTALYVTLDDSGSFQIFLGSLDGEDQSYVDKLDESEKVKDLIVTVQNSLANVLSTDSDAQEFYEMLESVD